MLSFLVFSVCGFQVWQLVIILGSLIYHLLNIQMIFYSEFYMSSFYDLKLMTTLKLEE